MGADSTLVSAAFREGSTRAAANVPNLKPLYESTAKQVKQSLGIITGVMDELKQDELNRIAGKDAQLQKFTALVDQMDKKLAIDKEPLPQKVIIAIEEGVKDLQDQFEAVNTYGDGDTRENERARTRINGELQKLISSAVNTRGGMMTLGKTVKNVNGIEFRSDKIDPISQMIDLKNTDTDDRVSVGIVDGQITFTASNYSTGTRRTRGPEGSVLGFVTEEYQYGEPISMNMDQILEAIPMKDYNADLYHAGKVGDAGIAGTAAQTERRGKDSFDTDQAATDIMDTIKTKEDFMNIAQRKLKGINVKGALGFRSGLLNSGELQLDLIKAMFTNNLGELSPIYDTFAALDADGKDGITSADGDLLTGEAKEIWKKNSMLLVDMITKTENPNFNLEVSKRIISNYLADFQKQSFEESWDAADKKEFPDNYKESGEGFEFGMDTWYPLSRASVDKDGNAIVAKLPSQTGRAINVMLEFINNPIEGKSYPGWDGQNYLYKDGRFYADAEEVTQSRISKNLGLWSYGVEPKDTYEIKEKAAEEEKNTEIPLPPKHIITKDFDINSESSMLILDELKEMYKDYGDFKFSNASGMLLITSPDGTEKWISMDQSRFSSKWKTSQSEIQAFIIQHTDILEEIPPITK